MGREPVYISSKDEIVALIGAPAYAKLAELCAAREELLSARPNDLGLSPHPADPK